MSAKAWIRRLSHDSNETSLVIPPIYMHNCSESSSTQRDAMRSESSTGTPRRRIFGKSWDSAKRRLSLPGSTHHHDLGFILHAYRHVSDECRREQQQNVGSLPDLVEVVPPNFALLLHKVAANPTSSVVLILAREEAVFPLPLLYHLPI